MHEDDARNILLVRAVESADDEHTTLTEDDRRYASRAAAELVRWHAAGRRAAPTAAGFISRRAELLVGKLAERTPALVRAAAALRWRPWVGVLVPAAALCAGLAAEHIADRQHVNILAFPLLAIVLWNLVVYLLLAAGSLRRLAGPGARGRAAAAPPGGGGAPSESAWPALQAGLRGALGWLGQRSGGRTRLRGTPGRALAVFAADWLRRSAPLTLARAARVLHLAAALFALGAVAGLYVRGLVFAYRAGWESTFLDAPQVHALLTLFLGPAAWLTGLGLPSAEALEALRFGAGAAAGAGAGLVPPVGPGPAGAAGDSAARWIHLYAVTVGAVVVLPRLALAAFAALQAHRRARHFALDLGEPYFRRQLGGFAAGPVRLRVVPYSYTLDEPAEAGLREVARLLLGEDAELALRPSVPFGAEDRAAEGLAGADPHTPLTVALFALAATPETENHGAFLDRLRTEVDGALGVVVDASGYLRRLGGAGAAGAQARVAERGALWQAFCTARGVASAGVDLTALDADARDRIERALGGAASPLAVMAAVNGALAAR